MEKILLATSIAPFDIENQQLAVQSWIEAGFDVVSCNSISEMERIRRYFPNIKFVPLDRDASATKGKPLVYVYDVLQTLKKSGRKVCGIINSDIHLRNIDDGLYHFLYGEASNALIYAHRYDIDKPGDKNGTEFIGLDLFLFSAELIDSYGDEDLVMGGAAWDYWMVFIARHFGHSAKLLRNPIAYHIRHRQTWNDEGDYDLKRKIALKHLGEASARGANQINNAVFENTQTAMFFDAISDKTVFVLFSGLADEKAVDSIKQQTHKNYRIDFGEPQSYDFSSISEDYVLLADKNLTYNENFMSVMLFALQSASAVTCQLNLVSQKFESHSLFTFDKNSIENLDPDTIIGCSVFETKILKCFDKVKLLSARREYTDSAMVSIEYESYAQNLINRLRGKRIYLYGAGRSLRYLLKEIDVSQVNILGIIDRNERLFGQYVDGIKIGSAEQLKTDNYDYVLITALRFDYEIFCQLSEIIPTEKIIRQFYFGIYNRLNCKVNNLYYKDVILISEDCLAEESKSGLKNACVIEYINTCDLDAAKLDYLEGIPGKNILIVVNSPQYDEIALELKNRSLTEYEHFIPYRELQEAKSNA